MAPQNTSSAPLTDSTIEDRMARVWWLLVVGAISLLAADWLGSLFATHSSSSYSSVNGEEAARYSSFLRTLGGLLFSGGLVERIALEIAALRR